MQQFALGSKPRTRDAAPAPAQPAAVPTPPGRTNDRKKAWIRAAIGATLALGVAGLTLRQVAPGQNQEATPATRAPAAWDGRVADLATFVEQRRQLTFTKPVAVDFVDADQFAARLAADPYVASGGDTGRRKGYDQAAAAAFGVDTKAGSLTPNRVGTAMYLPGERTIVVRSGAVTDKVRIDIVGQLVLALDDQRFGWSRNHERASQQDLAVNLANGDALRIRKAFIAEVGSDSEELSVDSLGSALAADLARSTGTVALDRLLADMPASSERILDPTQSDARLVPLDVAAPSLGAGEKLIGTDDLGPLNWYLILASAEPPAQALRAALGWGGDEVVFFQRAGVSCARAAWRGDSVADEAEMNDALAVWVAASPAERSARRVGNQLEVEACGSQAAQLPEPATLVTGPLVLSLAVHGLTEPSADTKAVPDTKAVADTKAVPDAKAVQLPLGEARCTALAVVPDLPAERLMALAQLTSGEVVRQLAAELAAAQPRCRGAA